jgi:hypothetical protein
VSGRDDERALAAADTSGGGGGAPRRRRFGMVVEGTSPGGGALALTWRLLRLALWSAMAAFVLSAGAGWMEDASGWSDDPRWIAFGTGVALVAATILAGTVARVMAHVQKRPSRFPLGHLMATVAVGFVIFAVQIIMHLGPLGVV